jgi:hypothetical protein
LPFEKKVGAQFRFHVTVGRDLVGRDKSPREQLCIVCMKNFYAHFSNFSIKTKKSFWLLRTGGGRQVEIASRAVVHCVHEKFLRAFFKFSTQKQKNNIGFRGQVVADR